MDGEQIPVVKLEGELMTNSQGINKIMQFYHDANQYRDTDVIIDCYNLIWLDANLTALLNALEHRLKIQNNIQLKADYKFLAEKFGVLFRNGWLQDDSVKIEDVQQTTIPCTSFTLAQEKEFCDYINQQLLCHRGMPVLESGIRRQIQNDLIEVYTNIYRHAQTTDPFFVSGQYYPRFGYFTFSMVDLGVGFLPPINKFTNGAVTTSKDAIEWALQGNSISGERLAGLGLQSIHDYMKAHKGVFQIYTGNDFWGTDLVGTIWEGHRPLQHEFQGSLLNLLFKYRS